MSLSLHRPICWAWAVIAQQTFIAKSKNTVLRSPNLTLFTAQLHLHPPYKKMPTQQSFLLYKNRRVGAVAGLPQHTLTYEALFCKGRKGILHSFVLVIQSSMVNPACVIIGCRVESCAHSMIDMQGGTPPAQTNLC